MELTALSCIVICLAVAFPAAAVTAPAGTIERVTKQQILVSIPPHGHGSPVPFLSSPSGKYAGYFVRSHTVPGAGGLGADFCYVEVIDTAAGEEGSGGGRSVWESECRPVSTVNTCTLMFSWNGLEVFDGAESVWHCDARTDDRNFLETLELVDEGDMRIRDKDGELAWRASDEPRSAQHCGAPGSPGFASALPPFAEPIGQGSTDLPFGLEGGAGNGINGNSNAIGNGGVVQTGMPEAELPQAADVGGGAGNGNGIGNSGVAQAAEVGGAATAAVGLGSQSMVDNSPYDSGAGREGFLGVGVLSVVLGLFVGF